jgi:hypothetical protein
MRTENSNKLEGQKLGLFIFECVMAVLYLAASALLLFTPMFDSAIEGGMKIALGVLIGIYGFFRVYRAVKKLL